MIKFGNIRRIWQRFAGDKRGGVFVFIAMALLPLVGAMGLATDAARGYLVKQRLSQAVDAAALAGGGDFENPDIEDEVENYFNANFEPGYMGATVAGPNVLVMADPDRLQVDATATIETTIMRLFGIDEITVGAETEVTTDAARLDLVMAFDLSGSMNESDGSGGTRIEAARTAALALVNVLFGSATVDPDLKIGVVPWNSMVNITENGVAYNSADNDTTAVPTFVNPIDSTVQSVIHTVGNSPVPLLFQAPGDWNGCVFSRYTDDGNDNNDADTSHGSGTFDGAEWIAWEPTGATYGGSSGGGGSSKKKKKKKSSSGGGSTGPSGNQCLDVGITALSSTRSEIEAAINDLTSPGGNTVIPAGLAWAWRVLSPEPPFDEGDASFQPQRIIVLLTDGSNYGGSEDAYKGALGSGSDAGPELDARLGTIADAIKASGITIITIQFANGGGDLQTLMQNVASSNSSPHYFYAPDGDALETVFEEIGAHVSVLRISK